MQISIVEWKGLKIDKHYRMEEIKNPFSDGMGVMGVGAWDIALSQSVFETFA